MAFRIVYNSFEDNKADALVHCFSDLEHSNKILELINDIEIKREIVKRRKNEDLFITSSSLDNYQYIINVLVPKKIKEDFNNSNLRNVIRKIINTALNSNYKKVVIPFIGVDSGYTYEEIYDAILFEVVKLNKQEMEYNDDLLEITVVGILKNNFVSLKNEIIEESFISGRKAKIYKIDDSKVRIVGEGKNMPFVAKSENYFYPYDYLIDYMEHYGINDIIFNNAGMDRRRKSKLKTMIAIPRIDIYRFAFLLGMDYEQTNEFLRYNGFSFSPFNPLDQFFKDYLLGKYGVVNTLFELTELSYGICGAVFTYTEE